MDFSAWSPSHALLVGITLLAFGGQLIAILTYLKITAKQHSTEIQQLADQIQKQGEQLTEQIQRQSERLEDRIDTRIGEVKAEISDVRGEIRDVRLEMSKLNQNHIDHLTHHD